MKSAFYLSILFICCFSSGCFTGKVSKADSLPSPTLIYFRKDLSEIDLSTIKHIAVKGRAQERRLEGENFVRLPIADDLLAHGKDSIPFLISKLDDETEMKRGTIDFWYDVYVGDIALVILNDFFTKKDGLTSTIPGFDWDNFLERGNDKDLMGIDVLRRYIEKHGRKNIKERWQKMWDENKENIVWDETEKCFKLNTAKK